MDCLICDRIALIKKGHNPFFVAELKTGYIVIGDHQYFEGYTVFLCKKHVIHLHDLSRNFRKKFLYEMSMVEDAVFKTFNPRNINCELLGNRGLTSHLHWHLFPRRDSEEKPEMPVWAIDPKISYADDARPTDKQLSELKKKLLKQLSIIGVPTIKKG